MRTRFFIRLISNATELFRKIRWPKSRHSFFPCPDEMANTVFFPRDTFLTVVYVRSSTVKCIPIVSHSALSFLLMVRHPCRFEQKAFIFTVENRQDESAKKWKSVADWTFYNVTCTGLQSEKGRRGLPVRCPARSPVSVFFGDSCLSSGGRLHLAESCRSRKRANPRGRDEERRKPDSSFGCDFWRQPALDMRGARHNGRDHERFFFFPARRKAAHARAGGDLGHCAGHDPASGRAGLGLYSGRARHDRPAWRRRRACVFPDGDRRDRRGR